MNNIMEHSFSDSPVTLDMQRSSFLRKFSHKTSFMQGKLIPILLDEVLPGDTIKLDMSSLVRMATPVFPVMDNAFLDVYFFFCPNRLVWDHWKEFCGENTSAPWTQQTEYTIPQVVDTGIGMTGDNLRYSLYDYFGLPLSYVNPDTDLGISVSALPFRSYYLIWNEWFRDQNLQYPINIYKGDSSVEIYNTLLTNDFHFGYEVLPVCRYADYFSTCLPAPQKGEAVLLPLGDLSPVITGEPHNVPTEFSLRYVSRYSSQLPIGSNLFAMQDINADGTEPGGYKQLHAYSEADSSINVTNNTVSVIPNNLYADLSNATASTVNELRQAFAVQRLYEKDALGGTRYREMLKAHFGVTSPDARMQVPEYLGGFRQPINIQQVVQTSSTDSVSPQGNTSAFSVTTSNKDGVFSKSFVEHGYLIGLACVRVEHSYNQGIERMWSRKRRFDFYYPALANIGNQPVYKKEIYCDPTDIEDKVFGYQEAWADYRYKPNRNSGGFKQSDTSPAPLQAWTFGDFYSEQPSLSDTWIREGTSNVAQVVAVPDSDQFIGDFYFELTSVRPMPLYSVPGLIDHH